RDPHGTSGGEEKRGRVARCPDEGDELPGAADRRGDGMTRGKKVLGDGVLLARQQLASANADQLDGDAARLRALVRARGRLPVGEPDHSRKDARLTEYAATRIDGQIRE